jgi:hypothetical protein
MELADNLAVALAVVAALVSLVFTFAIAERWMVRRRPHELAWTVAMGLFVAGALSVVWGVGVGWNPLSFRLYYLFGAVLNVAWLALGQLLISFAPRTNIGAMRAQRARGVLIAISAFATGIVLAEPLRETIAPGQLPKGDEVFGPGPRILAAVGSGGGALIVLVGTVASTVALLRARNRDAVPGAGARAGGTALIAVGTIVLGRSGGYAARGDLRGFSITLTVGVCVLFAGFLLATRRTNAPVAVRETGLPTGVPTGLPPGLPT